MQVDVCMSFFKRFSANHFFLVLKKTVLKLCGLLFHRLQIN